MDLDLKTEHLLMQLREKLNEDQLKLWLPPYYAVGTGSCDEEMMQLATRYCKDLSVDVECCLSVLVQLQLHACERLKERARFQDTGMATIKVRLPGEARPSSLPIMLSAMVSDLQEAVAKQAGVENERIKLIWNGQVLQSGMQLSTAGLQNGSQIMAVLLHGAQDDIQAYESRYRLLDRTKADAQLLAGSSNAQNEHYLQVADQSGKPIDLPPSERQALVVAMSLHEKGRAAMKKPDYSLALILFLESDREFSQCTSKLLDLVDNYALLNLDIAWCYLCLKNVTQIPDAEKRLGICEKNFHRSYGPNLERLMAIKGTSGNEAALFMRLHLLQAIIAFHQNKRQEASALFQRAEIELASLKVSDTSLASLLELGYTASEARLGLRATHGDVNAAAERITSLRQEKDELEEREREKRRLGRCIDGKQWVDSRLYAQLMAMGFTSDEARVALQNSNNDLNVGLQLLQDKTTLMKNACSKFDVLPDWIQQVVAVGFDPRMAKAALRKHFGDISKAVEELISRGGVLEDASCEDLDVDHENEASDSSGAARKNRKLERQAYKRLAEGISSDQDYLDLTLTQEEEFLQQYQALL